MARVSSTSVATSSKVDQCGASGCVYLATQACREAKKIHDVVKA